MITKNWNIALVIGFPLIALVGVLAIYYVFTLKKLTAQEKKITSMSELKKELRKRAHKSVSEIVDEMKKDIYDNIIVSTVMSWFDSRATLEELSNSVKENVEGRLPYRQKRIKLSFTDLEERLKSEAFSFSDQTIDINKISAELTGLISLVVGTVSTTVVAVLSGGTGTALIAGGPWGWVIGGVAIVLAYFVGKSTVDEFIRAGLHEVPFPPIFKRLFKKKIKHELKSGSNKFTQELFLALTNAVDEALED